MRSHGVRERLDDDEQLASSCLLTIGDASADILTNIDDCISLTTPGMWSKKVCKLAFAVGISAGLKGRMWLVQVLQSPHDRAHWDTLIREAGKDGLVLSSSEAENLEATVRPIIEPTSWMDW